jgi:hypothetical protein
METLLAVGSSEKTFQGGLRATTPQPRERGHGAALHIFFHPDCDRRPWHRTRSADPVRLHR